MNSVNSSKNNQPRLAVIVPVLNESQRFIPLLDWLSNHKEHLVVTIIDGGSNDDTVAVCEDRGYRVIHSPPGRAIQMNVGAGQANADIYWFVHADCLPSGDAIEKIVGAVSSGHVWGRFDVQLSGRQRIYRVIETLMNRRSCLTGIVTGDQGIFIQHGVFKEIGGFPDIPLMEDIAISKALRKITMPVCLRSSFRVSSRRWQQHGVFKTIFLMWSLRLRYFLGASPQRLHALYYARSDKEVDGNKE